MDYVMASFVEWMEMDARAIHFHSVDAWTVDVEWIASLLGNVEYPQCSGNFQGECISSKQG
jgi:hypothetical protein